MRDYRPKGSQTWDRFLEYHRCPRCGAIFESRDPWQYRLGHYEKELDCPRCQWGFRETRPQPNKAGY